MRQTRTIVKPTSPDILLTQPKRRAGPPEPSEPSLPAVLCLQGMVGVCVIQLRRPFAVRDILRSGCGYPGNTAKVQIFRGY